MSVDMTVSVVSTASKSSVDDRLRLVKNVLAANMEGSAADEQFWNVNVNLTPDREERPTPRASTTVKTMTENWFINETEESRSSVCNDFTEKPPVKKSCLSPLSNLQQHKYASPKLAQANLVRFPSNITKVLREIPKIQ